MKTRGLVSLICGVALGAFATAAPVAAADMAPAYKTAAMPPVAYNWSGFYAGVTAGGGMASLPVTDMDFFNGILNGPTLKSGGGVAGIHGGYNWQLAPSFLVGVEGDFNWSSFKASDKTCFNDCLSFDSEIASSKLDQFDTLRARFGLTVDRTLIYVTAGPAWGHIRSSVTQLNCIAAACGSPSLPPGAPMFAASDGSFHVGMALGAGVEYALTQNWIFRAEYMHLDFSSKDALFKDPTGALAFNEAFRARSTATADIARVGVSYKVW